MDNRPIGIFDSGLGGLAGRMALRELLPEEEVIHFGSGRERFLTNGDAAAFERAARRRPCRF